MTITHSMSWDDINDPLKQKGYFFIRRNMTILKDCKLVAKVGSKKELINYFRDLL